jgi:hypothetical protein
MARELVECHIPTQFGGVASGEVHAICPAEAKVTARRDKSERLGEGTHSKAGLVADKMGDVVSLV